MPEQPEEKYHARPTPSVGPTLREAAVPYAELQCLTNFSFLEGASHPDELVMRAAQLGYRALAITDRESLAGVVRAHVAAKEVGLKLIIGASVTPIDGPPLLLWAINRAGYGRLARLLTLGRRLAPKGECRLTFDDVARNANDMLAGVVLDVSFPARGRVRMETPRGGRNHATPSTASSTPSPTAATPSPASSAGRAMPGACSTFNTSRRKQTCR